MTEQTPRIGAVVLAGGRVPAPLAGLCTHRALLRINGRFMLEYLLDVLAATPSVVGIAVASAPEVLAELADSRCRKVPEGGSLVDNMQLGARALAETRATHLLFITGDIPLVTVEGIEDYIRSSLSCGAALTYPIIPREACEARFPGARRTYVRLREGTVTGGNAVFTTASLLDDQRDLIQGLYAARKQPLKLAQLLGWATVFRMLTGTLDLPYIEAVAGRILHAPAKAIITRYAEIGFDVDKPGDLQAVEQALASERAC